MNSTLVRVLKKIADEYWVLSTPTGQILVTPLLRSISIFSSSLYSNSECLYLNDKRQISLDAIPRATCANFSATHFRQVTRVETTR